MGRKSGAVQTDEAPAEVQPEPSPNGQPEPQPDPEPERNGEPDGNRPCYVYRAKNIKGMIWANQTERGVMLNAQVVRLYKRDGDDAWYTTGSFSAEDLLLVAEISRICAMEMFAMRQGFVPF